MKIFLSLAIIAVIGLIWKFYPVHSWDKTFAQSDKVDVKK